METSLLNKTAIVAGSTQGIGQATAIEFAKAGASVVLLARNEEKLKATLALLSTHANQTHGYIVGDFTHPHKMIVQVVGYLASRATPIHILVNNTGGPTPGPISDASAEQFLDTFNQHLICNHLLVQAVLPSMKNAGYGRIINVISTSVKAPLANLGVSNTIRAAVANWAKTLAGEVGKFGITVNNVLPGATATERLAGIINNRAGKSGMQTAEVEKEMMNEIPAGRFGKPEEVAAAISFLASPAAAYINGINLPVDGGRTASL
ncbi:MAG: SDR family oxidoreductase [Bacteroidetes bacterium]|nr:SDR family oxidoreductase [Bacteroidota bacterium]